MRTGAHIQSSTRLTQQQNSTRSRRATNNNNSHHQQPIHTEPRLGGSVLRPTDHRHVSRQVSSARGTLKPPHYTTRRVSLWSQNQEYRVAHVLVNWSLTHWAVLHH